MPPSHKMNGGPNLLSQRRNISVVERAPPAFKKIDLKSFFPFQFMHDTMGAQIPRHYLHSMFNQQRRHILFKFQLPNCSITSYSTKM